MKSKSPMVLRANSRRTNSFLQIASAAIAAICSSQAIGSVTYQPNQIQKAYSLTGVTFGASATAASGAGQTIAIIDWYNDANIQAEAAQFNSTFGLQAFGGTGNPTLTVVGQTGGAVPSTAASLETPLDVEWAHAMAPKANILLVEPTTNSFADINTAINYAKAQAGVSVISMSFGANDISPYDYSAQDLTFSQPAGHTGVSFVASTGDASNPGYPSTSPHVIAVGGTNLTLNANNTRATETVWTNSNGTEGTGYSNTFGRPTFQNGVSTNAKRGVPDLVMDADPATGVYVYANLSGGTGFYSGVGGTSLAAPLFAGLLADANQGRLLNGLTPLSGDDALTMIYNLIGTPLYSSCFYDVTVGTANGYSAGVGYDTPSGMGAPIASGLLQYLAGYTVIPEPTAVSFVCIPAVMMLRRRRR